jgi:hypothetical protein
MHVKTGNIVHLCSGFIGADCSVKGDVPPVITGLATDRVRDARINSGTSVNLYATGFAAVGLSSCKAVSLLFKI